VTQSKTGQKLDAISAALSKAKTVKVGFLEKAKYPDGTSVALIAALQDFGAPSVGIPPRPFFRNMVAAKNGEWPEAVRTLLKDNNYAAGTVLRLMGEGIAGQLRQSIVDTNDPPLKPATIARKGSSKPLVDTGVLINSIDFEVS
jgi:hypothetical protein